ncbi:MAG TPA: ribosomal protein S18-alanine N-acetyltransferase [bacterium]|nr:ribosomal protein S18-alanine N-acetyltransferase [bacterium]
MTRTLRLMTVADLDAVLAIENAVFTSPWPRDGFLRDLEINPFAHCHVLCDGAMIIGYVDYWVIQNEAHISTVATHPDHRRTGVAAELMRFGIADMKAKGVGVITLEVRQSNLPAQELYRTLGFRTLGLRKKYYQDNREDAVVMALDLNPPAPGRLRA